MTESNTSDRFADEVSHEIIEKGDDVEIGVVGDESTYSCECGDQLATDADHGWVCLACSEPRTLRVEVREVATDGGVDAESATGGLQCRHDTDKLSNLREPREGDAFSESRRRVSMEADCECGATVLLDLSIQEKFDV